MGEEPSPAQPPSGAEPKEPSVYVVHLSSDRNPTASNRSILSQGKPTLSGLITANSNDGHKERGQRTA